MYKHIYVYTKQYIHWNKHICAILILCAY
uniref:Uncharacterized protein n=1 Tax=Rhizophora mucronata TaxID=61149 RepID=A0A2P2PG95_RHIMU